MEIKTVADINQYTGSSINPLEHPEQLYELYSVPSFETGHPEIVKGKDIGSTKITVEEGDVLVCKINPRINRVWVVKHNTEYPLLASSEWIVVRNKNIDSNYLKWYFSSPTFRTLLNSQVAGIGGSLTRAQPKQVAKYSVPVPSCSEQQKVSENLDKVNALIALRKEQLAKLDRLVKSRFIELFGEYNHSNNKVFLEEISKFVTVGIANSATHAYTDSGIVMLRNQNIKENYLDENDLIYITPDFAKKYGSKQLTENDILVIRTGYPGVACLVPKKYEGCQTFTTLIVRLKDSTSAHANYVCHYINSSFGKDYVEQSKVGVAQQNFGAKALAKMPIVVPPMELQEEFATFVEQTDKSKMAIQQSLDKLELLKKSLMQEYFG